MRELDRSTGPPLSMVSYERCRCDWPRKRSARTNFRPPDVYFGFRRARLDCATKTTTDRGRNRKKTQAIPECRQHENSRASTPGAMSPPM
jgi:hypothetical protein